MMNATRLFLISSLAVSLFGRMEDGAYEGLGPGRFTLLGSSVYSAG